ncbi:MAG: response regulator transcription factor [Bacteroidetes bacterium]|nr:response regulator transcription factor [Bacteroidota bacterium]MBI3481482.1 response regulator transcription factor [Bacteroidota bacterium]
MDILVVDDQQIFRKAFVRLLKEAVDQGINCDEAQNGYEAIEKMQKIKFDLVFLDVSMPRMDGLEACRHIRTEHPKVPIIILTQFDNETLIFHFFNIGVHSFLSKDANIDELTAAIDSARREEKYFPPWIDLIIQKKRHELSNNSWQKIELSCQEKRLLQLLQEGHTSKEIALEMNLAVNTIHTYRDRLLEKTRTRNVAQLISFGFRIGLLKLGQ